MTAGDFMREMRRMRDYSWCAATFRYCRQYGTSALSLATAVCLISGAMGAFPIALSADQVDEQHVRDFLDLVAAQESRIQSIHVKLEETRQFASGDGSAVEPERSGHGRYQGFWARDSDGRIAHERIQTETRIPELVTLQNVYYVRKEGRLYTHSSRDLGRRTGQIESASRVGNELIPMQYASPWSWLNGATASREDGSNFRMVTEEHDGRPLRRVTWDRGGGRLTVSILVDPEKGLLPIEYEVSSNRPAQEGQAPYHLLRKVLAVEEVAEGIWLPTLVETTQSRRPDSYSQADRNVSRVAIVPVAVNQPLDEDLFKITWEPGMLVYDRDSKAQYRVLDEGMLAATAADDPGELFEAVGVLLSAEAQREEHERQEAARADERADHTTEADAAPAASLEGAPAAAVRDRRTFWIAGLLIFGLAAGVVVMIKRKPKWKRN